MDTDEILRVIAEAAVALQKAQDEIVQLKEDIKLLQAKLYYQSEPA